MSQAFISRGNIVENFAILANFYTGIPFRVARSSTYHENYFSFVVRTDSKIEVQNHLLNTWRNFNVIFHISVSKANNAAEELLLNFLLSTIYKIIELVENMRLKMTREVPKFKHWLNHKHTIEVCLKTIISDNT